MDLPHRDIHGLPSGPGSNSRAPPPRHPRARSTTPRATCVRPTTGARRVDLVLLRCEAHRAQATLEAELELVLAARVLKQRLRAADEVEVDVHLPVLVVVDLDRARLLDEARPDVPAAALGAVEAVALRQLAAKPGGAGRSGRIGRCGRVGEDQLRADEGVVSVTASPPPATGPLLAFRLRSTVCRRGLEDVAGPELRDLDRMDHALARTALARVEREAAARADRRVGDGRGWGCAVAHGDRGDPALVLLDDTVWAVAADHDHVAGLRLGVVGAEQQVHVAGVGLAWQGADVGDLEVGGAEDQRAVVVSVRAPL